MIRNANSSDIEAVLEIEKGMYWNSAKWLEIWKKEAREKMKNTFMSCLKIFPEGFFVAIENDKVMGFIILELVNEVKTIPYIHNSKNYHKPDGRFAYVEGFGILKRELSLKLYKKAIEFAESCGCEKLIVVTHHEKEHDALEMATLLSLGFKKGAEITEWEVYPEITDKADIWSNKL